MGVIQSVLKAVLPKSWMDDMEKESRAWKLRCNTCGQEQSIWEIGGIRYKAIGNPRKLVRCTKCGFAWHTLEYRPDEASGGSKS